MTHLLPLNLAGPTVMGCVVLGPTAIKTSRAAYDDAIVLTFRVLEALMSARMAEAVDHKAAPVLTVPASK